MDYAFLMTTIFALLIVLLLSGFAYPVYMALVYLIATFTVVTWWLLALPFRLVYWGACAAWKHIASYRRHQA